MVKKVFFLVISLLLMGCLHKEIANNKSFAETCNTEEAIVSSLITALTFTSLSGVLYIRKLNPFVIFINLYTIFSIVI